jgi:hypothetical protein
MGNLLHHRAVERGLYKPDEFLDFGGWHRETDAGEQQVAVKRMVGASHARGHGGVCGRP